MCPHCGESVMFASDIDPKDVICPSCEKAFEDAE